MPNLGEIIVSLMGAWRLARNDQSGMNWFDISFGGFLRSFWAALIALPLYMLLVGIDLPAQQYDATTREVFLIRGFGYVLAWIAFPLAALPLTRLINRGDYYFGLIIALNWAAVLQIAVMAATTLFSLVLPGGIDLLVVLAAYAAVLYYQYFVTRTALQVNIGTAIALVLIDVLLAMFVYSFTTSLLTPVVG